MTFKIAENACNKMSSNGYQNFRVRQFVSMVTDHLRKKRPPGGGLSVVRVFLSSDFLEVHIARQAGEALIDQLI